MTLQTSARTMRASLDRAFPRWSQPLWTWLTGLALSGQEPVVRWTPRGHLVLQLLILLAATVAAGWVAELGGWAWLAYPPLVLVATGALRALYIVTGHFAAHGSFSDHETGNAIVGELASTLTLTLDHETYERHHAVFHHSKRLGTPEDPDTKLVGGLGFVPGVALEVLRRRLAWTLISPRFHASFTWGRLAANLRDTRGWRRLSAWGLHGLILGLGFGAGHGWGLVFGWLIPLVPLYNASALLQFISEHRWFRVRAAEESAREHQAKLTFGRFLGDPAPEGGAEAWAMWWLRLAFLHLPARVAVLVGDLPQHDLHHLRPRGEWANAAYTRRDVAAEMADRWPRGEEDEISGSIFRMADEVLRGLAAQSPLTEEEAERLAKPVD